MRPIPRTLLIPALGLLLALGAAVAVSLGASASPETRLHQQVSGYLRALAAGDPGAAAPYREDRNPEVERGRARALEGVKWFLAGQRIQPGPPPEAYAHVLWLSDDDAVLRQEVQIWRPGPEGRWLLWALDGGRPGRRR